MVITTTRKTDPASNHVGWLDDPRVPLHDRFLKMQSHGWRSQNWVDWPTPESFPTKTLAFAVPASEIISQHTTEAL